MKLEVKVSELRKQKLMIATPMYGGNANGLYVKSIIELTQLCDAHGIKITYNFLFNESLVTRARNYLVDSFLVSDATHLIFIDADIQFDAKDVLALVALDKDIIGGTYPKKQIAWDKVYTAAKQLDLENPNLLCNFSGDLVFNTIEDKSFDVTEPTEVSELGTGFLCIRRNVFEEYSKKYPELKYKPDHPRTKNWNGSKEITAFFDTIIDPESRRYLSEDYMFCQYARKIGFKVYLAPWIKLNHVGTYVFESDIRSLSQLKNTSLTGIQQDYKPQMKNNQA